jgi:DNA-binding NarL/FixJ family response regulator
VLVRAGLRALLDAEDDVEVAAGAGRRCGAAAVRLGRQVKPDVVLMDIRMPGTDGPTATREILAGPELATVRVVMLTTFDLDEYMFEAIRSGAAGFLVKNAEPTELVRAVRVTAEGDALLSPGVTRRLIGRFGTLCSPPDGSAQRSAGQTDVQLLTEREREVVTLVAQGLSNDQIAGRLSVSPLTAKTTSPEP